MEEAGKMTRRRFSFAKRTSSSSETKGKELKMSDSKDVASIFKALEKGLNLKGTSGLRGGKNRKKMPSEEGRRVKERCYWCGLWG